MCHLIILFYNCSIKKYESNKNSNVFWHALNNIGFLMKGKLLRAKSVVRCHRFRIHCYVATPNIHVNAASIPNSLYCSFDNYGLIPKWFLEFPSRPPRKTSRLQRQWKNPPMRFVGRTLNLRKSPQQISQQNQYSFHMLTIWWFGLEVGNIVQADFPSKLVVTVCRFQP